jgi:adenylate cyclase
MGDAVVADDRELLADFSMLFGAPEPLAAKERAAVAAGRSICAAVAAVGGDGPLAVAVGIATGRAFVGNVLAVDRAIWTAIGDSVNLAARLQALARDLQATIVIDARTWSALADGERRAFVCRNAVRIRGRARVEDVYLVPLAGSASS